ncbi:MAG TPA: Rieske 2Fe-2S domain-containing protein [Polyangiales bacterium]|nr:Rieske 2Fe-2S domain-containing protein [Polyangiales bacterium]
MSIRYVAVQWNRFKLIYDAAVLLALGAFIALFEYAVRAQLAGDDQISEPVRSMRAFGSAAFLLLSAILCIGPLARLNKRFVPLLYNRRHLGVMMCGIALVHAQTVLGHYHAYSNVPKLVSLFRFDAAITPSSLPFQIAGALALGILMLMAATSHDFWQRFLGAKLWKGLHMSVYLAYALAVIHVGFGALQIETHPLFTGLILGSVAAVCGLHLAAARVSAAPDRRAPVWVEIAGTRYLDAGAARELPQDRATPLCVPGAERIAVIRHKHQFSAIHGVCAHQGGPLYEGKVIDGCLTCPWHGWQYRPEDGCAPPPFVERLITYPIRVQDGRVLVDPRPLPAGTKVTPAVLEEENTHDSAA